MHKVQVCWQNLFFVSREGKNKTVLSSIWSTSASGAKNDGARCLPPSSSSGKRTGTKEKALFRLRAGHQLAQRWWETATNLEQDGLVATDRGVGWRWEPLTCILVTLTCILVISGSTNLPWYSRFTKPRSTCLRRDLFLRKCALFCLVLVLFFRDVLRRVSGVLGSCEILGWSSEHTLN